MKKNPTFSQICRNRASLLYAMLLLSLLLGACADEPLCKEPEPGQGVQIHLRIPAQSINQTRAGGVINDAYVDPTSVYVFVLSGNTNDSSDRVLQVVNAVAGSTDDLFFAKLTENSEAKHVYLVANAKEIIEKTGVGELAKMTLGQLKLQLNKTVTLTSTVISQSIDPQPMFGEMELPSGGINTETTIGSAGSPVPLIRSTSKITIANKAPANNFTLVGANLFHAPQLGYIVPEQAATGNRYPTGVEGNIEKMISTPAVGNETEAIIYSFESAKKTGESTFVIIQTEYLGETHYYRLNLNNKEADYALLRNHHYMVDILKIDKKGYTTAEEASQNPAANIEYVINVIDETGRNIIAADGSYLAVSQTEYYYYTHAEEKFTNREVAIVTYKAPASVKGSCIPSPGITIEGGFAVGNGGVQSFPLKVSMDDGIDEGTVTLQLGSLKRDIKVYRKTVATDFHFGTLLQEFKGKGYISGTVDKKDESWIKLTSADEPTEEEQFSSLEDKEGKINIRIGAHLGDKGGEYRTGAVDLFREDEIGNARVEFNQKMFDIYTPTQKQAQLRPFTYIATFHRWNQTGERIIRVDAKVAGEGSSANVNWRVHVISGDFIRLSKTRSADNPGVGHYNFYGEKDNTAYPTGESVEALQISKTDGKTEITSKEGGEPIYFRVGLTGKLASATAQPRYGLIALVVNTHTLSPTIRYIYVRQGEEADYLMRPEDHVEHPSQATMGNRPLAKKISPFNLTDDRGKERSDLSGIQSTHVKFADYPSQGGYHYQPTTKNGWWADEVKGENGVLKPGYKLIGGAMEFNSKDHEICPQGYRRPGEGTSTNSIISTSEMRQSMWLYPQNGQAAQTQNFIMGYMADGYYDRREMNNLVTFDKKYALSPPEPIETTIFTAVESGAKIAYMGVLSFNPHSLASIFLPLSGHFKWDNIVDKGISAGFWTQARNSAQSQYWTVDVGYLYPGEGSGGVRFLADNYQHASDQANNVRCIKDE